MDADSVTGAARRALGPVGAYLPASFTAALDIGRQRDAARRLEAAGYGAAWANEGIGGKDVLAQLGILAGRRCSRRPIRAVWCSGSGLAIRIRPPPLARRSDGREPRCAVTFSGWTRLG